MRFTSVAAAFNAVLLSAGTASAGVAMTQNNCKGSIVCMTGHVENAFSQLMNSVHDDAQYGPGDSVA